MIVLVWPAAHHIFRPATTDVLLNGTFATLVIVGSLTYGFVVHGFGFIQKYFPLKRGMGLVTEINHWYDYITK